MTPQVKIITCLNEETFKDALEKWLSAGFELSSTHCFTYMNSTECSEYNIGDFVQTPDQSLYECIGYHESEELGPGDRVKVTRDVDMRRVRNLTGTVKFINEEDEDAAVEFDQFIDGHNCDGYTLNGYGLFVNHEDLSKINEPKQDKPMSESNEVTASKEGIIKQYENGCSDVRATLEALFPETINEYREDDKLLKIEKGEGEVIIKTPDYINGSIVTGINSVPERYEGKSIVVPKRLMPRVYENWRRPDIYPYFIVFEKEE